MTGPAVRFGDDGSDHADLAWLWINSQQWPRWRLDVVSCATPPLGPPLPPERSTLHAWEPPAPRQCFTEPGFAEVRHLHADADPRIVLTEPSDASLLVIGAKGDGTLKRLHLGSTAEYVLHYPPAPVVVVKKATTVRSVLVATDGSTHAQRAVATLAGMPWTAQIDELVVLGVSRARPQGKDPAITAAVDHAVDTLAAADVGKPIAMVTHGHVAQAVLSHADEISADLIVLGTRGLGVLRGLWVGSTANGVVKTATSSLLLASASQPPHG